MQEYQYSMDLQKNIIIAQEARSTVGHCRMAWCNEAINGGSSKLHILYLSRRLSGVSPL